MPVAVASARQKLAHTFIELAIEGLARMFVPDRQLFCSVLRRQPDGRLVRNGISRRYTMMTLLGLHRLETVGMASPIATEPVLNELLRDLSWISTSGDLGNLLWTCAELDPERLPSVYRRINLFDALPRFQDYARASTTELAWLLTGLSLAQEAASPGDWQFEDLTVEVNQKLHANQGPHGIFGHLAPDRSVAGRVRGCIGSFADQVYPIFALSQFSRVVGDSASILHASQCAAAIVNAQGPNGEWWWHYHSGTGLVTLAYPVYSVHQDGMAPMALQALSAVYRE